MAVIDFDCEAVGSAPDAKQFTLLFLADVPANTTLFFSNADWAGNTIAPTSKIIGWSAATDSPPGTVITYWGNSAGTGPGSVSSSAAAYGTCTNVIGTAPLGMSNSAPFTLSVFTGSTTTPIALTALLDGGTWNSGGIPLPNGLTDTASAWSLASADYQHAGYYNCTDTADTEANLDAAINADNGQTSLSPNWVTGTTVPGLDPCGSYTITSASSPTVSASPSFTATNSPGGSATPTFSASPTNSPSPNDSPTNTCPPSPTFTQSPIESATETNSASPSPTVTVTATFTETATQTDTPTAAPTFPTYTPVPGASTLNPGDVAFTAYTNTDSGKQFSFMLMTAVTQGTTISISNANWNGTTLSSTTSKYITWIADQAYPAGTTVIYTRVGGNGIGVNIGYVEDGGNGGAGIGWSPPKLLTAFQGSPASPTFLSAMLLGQTW
ncbi:MAG TPA: hypothetical protein VK786_05580, partial [bacterium]|nr:hypothetical protein [bacterium]